MKQASQRGPRAAEDGNGRIESVKRSQVIYDQLRKEIITGAIERGESLTETQLATRFKCSQAPVREACIALMHEGFLTITPYKGFAVSEITLKEIKNLYEVRLLVECASAKAAARMNGASAHQLDEIEKNIRVLEQWPEDLWELLQAEAGFHLAIARASDNELLEKIVNLVWGRFQQFYYKTAPQRQRREDLDSVKDHWAIFEAIRSHDPEKASATMHQHILFGRETALKLYFDL